MRIQCIPALNQDIEKIAETRILHKDETILSDKEAV
jgi:hypothetical protein